MTETCQDCQTQPAEVHCTEIKDRIKSETHLCKLCWERRERLSRSPRVTPPGPDGFLWQLHEYEEQIILQRTCDAEGCDKGLIYAPVRDCSACRGSGFKTKTFQKLS